MEITLKKAMLMVDAAQRKAEAIGVPMVIAVVDSGGNLVAHVRQDGALLASVGISLDKAYTAAAVKLPTQTLGELALPGQPLYGIQSDNGGRLVTFGGGVPIMKGNQLLGAIGVSGGSVEEDITCAEAGLAAFG